MSELVAPEFKKQSLSVVIEKATPIVLRAPIETPVRTSFGTMTDRPAVYLLLEDTQGNKGVGEVWCNFPGCGAEHRARLLNTVILPELTGKEFSDPEACYYALQNQFRRLAIQTGEFGPVAQCIAGIDIAMWDLVAKRSEVPLYKLFGASSNSDNTSINVYASGINPTGSTDTFLRCRDAGYNSFKLKIGFGADIDFPNIESICGQLGSDDSLMVDANQAWTLDEAITHSGRLADFPVNWLEEPMMADTPVAQWNKLAQVCSIPLAGGENIADAESFSLASQSDWLGILQPDVCKWGGFSAVLPVARQALANGKRYCPHFLGGGVGLVASAHLLAAVGGDGALEIDCNPNPLREEIYNPAVEDGTIDLGAEPGLGICLSTLDELRCNRAYMASAV